MLSILVAHAKTEISQEIKHYLSKDFYVKTTTSFETCLRLFEQQRFEFTFIDLDLFANQITKSSIKDYQTVLKQFWKIFPMAQLIMISTQDRIRETVNIVKAGANNYITTPINSAELQHVLESTDESSRIQHELDYLRDRFWQDDSLDVVRTNSEQMKKTFDKVRYVAETKTTVLLTGETGVGKGVIAKLIHRHSDRRNQPFIHVHCGAIADSLVESELFGHEKGSFTGAIKRKFGRFEIATNGTIFLDEIGTVTSSTQIKLLQVLQDKIFQRVGGEEDIESNARVIAASNYDLKKLVENGEYRSDLYYRLSVFPIEIPPLRERKEDVPLLASFFVNRLNSIYLKDITEIHPLVIEALQEYPWPGNIREFENLIERAYILEHSSVLTPESFPQELFDLDKTEAKVLLDTTQTLAETRKQTIDQVERQYLKELLSVHRGRINKTAQAAGITPRQLHKLLAKYQIHKEEFRSAL
ncbi:sigma-54 dependent transcriptional regulator [bacterium]|nr:sigma-54 dependent transcriptional regulator [bacterium]